MSVLEVKDLITGELVLASSEILSYLVGLIVSFIVGYISLKLLLKMIQKGKMGFFAFYLIIPAIISVVLGFIPA